MMKLNPAATITEEFAERIKSENRSAKMMKLAPLIVLACLVVVFLIVCGASFLSPKNIMNILNQMALPLVVALGLTFVIMLGSIDLSIDGSVGMAGSLFACFVLNSEFAYDLGFLSVVIAVGVSMLCGLLIGLCHVYLKIPSFMASFAFMYICKGIGMVSYQGHPPTIKDPVITALPTTTFLGIPFITWVAIVMFLLCFFIQEYTAFGRHIYAVGTNENIPRSVGVSVEKVKIGVFNIALSNAKQMAKGPFVSGAAVRRQAKHWIGELRIKTPGPQALLRQLSGGNQQKVVFSRALASGADILLLNHPTRGVDVGAKEEIYALIRDMTDEGKAVIVLGDTTDECIGLCSRLLVMKDGLVTGEFDAPADHKPSQVDVVSLMM